MELRDLVALLAAFVAAAFAAAKLIADKESKISDFRKDWISSFREALAKCLAEAHVISGRIRIRARHQLQTGQKSLDEKAKKALEDELTEHWAEFRQSFYLVMLHLNFAETSVPLYAGRNSTSTKWPDEVWGELSKSSRTKHLQLVLEKNNSQKVDSINRATPAAVELARELEDLLSDLTGDYNKIGGEEIYDRIDKRILNATLYGNLVLKPEWNRIKKGERQYRRAVLVSSLIALGGIVSIGYFAFSSGIGSAKVKSAPAIQLNLK